MRYAFVWFYLFLGVINLPFAINGHVLNGFIVGWNFALACSEYLDVYRGGK